MIRLVAACVGLSSASFFGIGACLPPIDPGCGPPRGRVARVIDGDTIELESGQRIRYLLVDTPESTSEVECYGEEAASANARLVLGREVSLEYDLECTDRYGRLLAFVSADDPVVTDISAHLLREGYGCVLEIPPNGADRVDMYSAFESRARRERLGLWGSCAENPCGR